MLIKAPLQPGLTLIKISMNNEDLQRQLDEINRKLGLLYNSVDIPHDVEQAFRTRFRLERVDEMANITTSAKGATSENQAVNEGGVATYSVLKAPDAFIEITIDGALKYVPIYT